MRGQLGYLELVPDSSLVHIDRERNLLACQEMSFGLRAQVPEIRRLQEQPQELRPLGQFFIPLAGEEPPEAALVFIPRHCLDAMGEVRLQLYSRHSHEESNQISRHLYSVQANQQGYQEEGGTVKPIELEPAHSTTEIPGKCIKCLAEKELDSCLRQLLSERGEDRELAERFQALASFLSSPESAKLRKESERYLAEGKKVRLIVRQEAGRPRYEIKVD